MSDFPFPRVKVRLREETSSAALLLRMIRALLGNVPAVPSANMPCSINVAPL
jgi:hypothetical protein